MMLSNTVREERPWFTDVHYFVISRLLSYLIMI